MSVTAALELARACLDSAGILTTTDPGKIHPPGAWLAARRLDLDRRTMAGLPPVVVDAYLIARDAPIPVALDILDGMLAAALDAAEIHGLEVTDTALDEAVTLPHGGGPLPSFRLSLLIDP